MNLSGPVLVRIHDETLSPEPAVHAAATSLRTAHVLRTALFAVGICCVAWYAYTLADTYVYQAFENWAFDQQIAGRTTVTFADYVREQTPFGLFAPKSQPAAQQPPAKLDIENASQRPATGTLLGRIDVPRLGVSAIVREGTNNQVLRTAVGHIPSTALAGENGNFAIAAHRDTLFRALKDIHIGDIATFESADGVYTYRVFSTRIVKPTEVSVLRPDGGLPWRTEHLQNVSTQPQRLLTMITCYPFYYVGSAPRRFVVQAHLVSKSGPPARRKRL